MTSQDFEKIDQLTTGPHSVKIECLTFALPCGALSALKTLDQMFDMETKEVEKPGYEFEVWRKLKVNSMELRFQFYAPTGHLTQNVVLIHGFKVKEKGMSVPQFDGECYAYFLSRIALCAKDHFMAAAMGQHARLGSASLLYTLPDGILKHLMQPMFPVLELWDEDKEDELQAAIELQELEETKAKIDELVASEVCDNEASVLFEGNFHYLLYNMGGLCVKLDKRLGVFTDEVYSSNTFFAKRMLTLNGKTLHFTFNCHRFNQKQSHIRVRGLGQVDGVSFNCDAYNYFLEALFRNGQDAVLTVTTGSDE
jgi:hypothetical protein